MERDKLRITITNKKQPHKIMCDVLREMENGKIKGVKGYEYLIKIFSPLVSDMMKDHDEANKGPHKFTGTKSITLDLYEFDIAIIIDTEDHYGNAYLYGDVINDGKCSWNPYLLSLTKKYPVKIDCTITNGVHITIDEQKYREEIIDEIFK